MKTPQRSLSRTFGRTNRILTTFVVTIATALTFQLSQADIPDRTRPSATLSGMYQVTSSSDPLFPVTERREWFLDFGEGTSKGVHSGTVAVSLRENPNVKVRIMVWQYLPEQGALLIGNQFERGSRRAVAKGMWSIGADSTRIVMIRDNARIIMRRADPKDY